MSPAASAASPTRTAPGRMAVGRPGPPSRSPTAATGGSEASANAPRGPPEMRSDTIPPRNAHHTPSRAPAAIDHDAATNIGSEGRAPPTAIKGATVPWRSAAASGIRTPRTNLIVPASRDQAAVDTPSFAAGSGGRAPTDRTGRRSGWRRMRHVELLLELRERIFIAQLRANVDEDQAKRRCDGNRDEHAEQTVERAAGEQREDHDRGM